jgi:hypothetical protein
MFVPWPAFRVLTYTILTYTINNVGMLEKAAHSIPSLAAEGAVIRLCDAPGAPAASAASIDNCRNQMAAGVVCW